MLQTSARAFGQTKPFGRARAFFVALMTSLWFTANPLSAEPVAPAPVKPAVAPAAAAQKPVRTLRLLVLVDGSYVKAYPAWKPRLGRIIRRASDELERRLGLRLAVTEYLPWVYTGKLTSGRQAWQHLARTPLVSADLVVGYTAATLPQPGPAGRLELGNASAFGRQALVADVGGDEALAARVLIHELGHVFGAFHVADPQCVMQPAANAVPNEWQFAPQVEEIWRQSLVRFDPRRGVESVPSDHLARISQLFIEHHRADESLGDNPVAQGFAYQAILALAANRRPRARQMAQTALNYAAENVAAVQVLGEAALRDEDWLAAVQWLERADALAPHNAEILVGLAQGRWRLGRLATASEAANQAQEAAPNSPATLLVAAHCARLAGDAHAHVELRKKLVTTSPRLAKRLDDLTAVWSEDRYAALVKCRSAAETVAQQFYRNSIGMRFAKIPSRPDTPSQGAEYWLGVTEVTHDEYRKVMQRRSPGRYAGRGGNCPVEQVSWTEAVEFCRRLTDLDAERTAGARYRLPSEAEWQWACRAKTATREFFGDNPAWLADYAWLTDGTHPVGVKAPNPWGLCDMLGNVAEWCHDWYAPLSAGAAVGAATNARGPAQGSRRVVRGGASDASDGVPRGTTRESAPPDARSAQIGFRVVLELAAE